MPAADSQRPENEIFISYSKEDRARVQVLVAAIEREGWKVFWDQEILPGEDWESYIGIHLDAAAVVIAVWSNLSVSSRYVRSEVNRANKRNAVVPVLFDVVEPPFGLEHIQAADLVEWLENGRTTLPTRLKSSILRRMPPPSAGAASTAAGAEEQKLHPDTLPRPNKKAIAAKAAKASDKAADKKGAGNPDSAWFATDEVGGYNLKEVHGLIGEYVCVRPYFDHSKDLAAYVMELSWSETEGCMVFREKERDDAQFGQSGRVYMPAGQPYLNLVTIGKGNFRHIVLCRPKGANEHTLRGLVLTLGNPSGVVICPISAPFVLFKPEWKRPQLGKIREKDPDYALYRKLLDETTKDFVRMIV